MPSSAELIAAERSEEEVGRAIGADWLVFQDMDDLVKAVSKGNTKIKRFDASVFTGEYVTGDVSGDYLSDLQTLRNDAAKKGRRDKDDEAIDLHNTA
jgi:amidophosphoribosyltransferase